MGYVEQAPNLQLYDCTVDPFDTSVEEITAPAIEIKAGLQHEPIRDDHSLLEKAHAIRAELEQDIARQKLAISESIPPHSSFILRDFEELKFSLHSAAKGNWQYLDKLGFAVDRQWIGDITRSMLRDRPVEVQLAAIKPPEYSDDALERDQPFREQQTGLLFGAMLRRVQGLEYVRPVVMVDDIQTRTDPLLAGLQGEQLIKATYDRLGRLGIITVSDVPGKDFLVIPASRNIARADELIEHLDDTETGVVADYEDGRIFLRPSKRVCDSMAEQYKGRDSDLRKSGILLRKTDGTFTPTALEAASYLHAINADFTHVRLRNVPLISLLGRFSVTSRDSQSLSTVLQTLHITHPDRDHAIYYDSRVVRPEWAVYALTCLLKQEVDKVIQTLGELDDVAKAMKPKDYFDHNYNTEMMWPEDAQGTRVIGSELPLHYSLGEIESAAIVGYGPFSYPGIAIAPFMAKGAKIDISDLLPANIEFAREWFEDKAYETHARTYRRFADRLRQGKQSGRFYTDAEKRLRETGNLHVAALEDLASDSAQVVLESFVSCSNNIEKYGFYESIRQKARIMTWTPRSMMISVHMVGSGGWNNSGDHEGIKIPAANLTIGNIEDGYRSAGLRVVNCVPLHADATFREDYKGMVVIFAKPDTIDRPQPFA